MAGGSVHQQVLLHAADTASAGAIVGSIAGMLPPLAAFVAVVWYVIQIYESRTVQKWLRVHRVSRYRILRRRRRHRKVHPPHVSGSPS